MTLKFWLHSLPESAISETLSAAVVTRRRLEGQTGQKLVCPAAFHQIFDLGKGEKKKKSVQGKMPWKRSDSDQDLSDGLKKKRNVD